MRSEEIPQRDSRDPRVVSVGFCGRRRGALGEKDRTSFASELKETQKLTNPGALTEVRGHKMFLYGQFKRLLMHACAKTTCVEYCKYWCVKCRL